MGNSVPAAGGLLQEYRGGWLLCLDEQQRVKCINRQTSAGSQAPTGAQLARQQAAAKLDELMRELFRLQDLNKNDLLEELELIKLNQKIAMLHYGKDSKNAAQVEEKYRNHFREHLDAEGKPVDFTRFREYMIGMLNSIDPDPRVQEMTLEQWIAEAESGRAAFFVNSMSSVSDFEFTKNMSFSESQIFGAGNTGVLPPTSAPSSGISFSPGGPKEESTLPSAPQSMGVQGGFAPSWQGQSFGGMQRLPPEAGSMEIGARGAPGALPPTSGVTPAGYPAEYPAGTQGSEFLPHPGMAQSGCTSVEDSFLPSPSRMMDSTHSAPMGTLPEDHVAPRSHLQALPETGTLEAIQTLPQSQPRFQEGQTLEVWSESKKAWLPGVVLAAYSSDTSAEGYQVPAGTVKVSSGSGIKWVLPQQLGMLRSAGSTGYRKGDAIQVWSDSKSTWMDGVVEEAYSVDTKGRGFTIPAGSLLVKSAAGTSKWVMPDQISKVVRSSPGQPSGPGFAKGEKVQVWSDSRKDWLLGVVQEVFLVNSKSEGFDVPAGSLKVLSETGVKWILPPDRDRMLRKAQAPSEPDLKSMLKSALSEPSALHRQAESVWTSALLPGQKVLPAEHAAYALEGLAEQFGLKVELEGAHLDAVKQRAYSFAGGHDGMTLEQFEKLCREMMSELYGNLGKQP